MQLATERTRLFVEGVHTAITADVTRRRRDGMVVTQALPFLRLDTPVHDDAGTRARIASVAISMEGDVPRLMLELVRDEPSADAPSTERDDTLESFTPGVSLRPARTDSTVPYDFRRNHDGETEVVAITEPIVPRASVAATAIVPVRVAREPWWSSLARRLVSLLSMWTRRAFAG